MASLPRRALLAATAAAAQTPSPEKRHIGLLVYPGFYLPDLVGPWAVWDGMPNTQLHFIWKQAGPIVKTGPGINIEAGTTFGNCPADLTVLFVPGGTAGTVKAMEDAETREFLAHAGARARWVTSVCTGSLVLGAAGLLKGYKATTHWVAHEVLADLGATPVKARIVQDRNRISGGGVTAGLDFGLAVAAQLMDVNYAKLAQLTLEYDPQPPFQAGSPEKAGAVLTAQGRSMFKGFVAGARRAALRSKA